MTQVFVLQIDAILFFCLKSVLSQLLQIFISIKWLETNIYYPVKLHNSYIPNIEIKSYVYNLGKVFAAMGKRKGFLSLFSSQ